LIKASNRREWLLSVDVSEFTSDETKESKKRVQELASAIKLRRQKRQEIPLETLVEGAMTEYHVAAGPEVWLVLSS
jgi:hypothetical protein